VNLVKIYADRGISGKALKNREAFSLMLSESKSHVFDMLVVKDISRFARNTVDFLTGIRKLRSNGIDVRFLSCNMDSLGESEFVLTMFAALAQEESYNLSKRIMFGKKVSAGKGRTPPLLYGYDKTGTYSLSVREDESRVIKKIFSLYTKSDMGLRKIAAFLNEKDIPTKLGKQWNSKTVRRVLSNPIYCGILVNNKSETVDFIDNTRRFLPKEETFTHYRPDLAIVSEKTFEKAQNILKKRCEESCHKQKL
jgi:DNA invertase Pin-like site-specific DNA recombinase